MDLSAVTPAGFLQAGELDVSRFTGAGVRVAVVDSGVDNTHPAIGGRIRGGAVVDRFEDYVVVGEYDSRDLFGHGTAVASIVLDVAPGAEVHSVRVLGTNLASRSEIILQGLRWAIDQGFHVINCSFGTCNLAYMSEYKEVVDLAYCRDVVVTAACNNNDFAVRELPSAFPAVVAVDYLRGQVDDPLTLYRRRGQLVEYVARGANLQLPWLNHKVTTTSGSSFATPHVTGIVCRLLERYPGLRPFEVKTLLHHLADPLPEPRGP